MSKILFVEDDIEYQVLLTGILEKEGYDVDSVSSSLEAIEMLEKGKYDLVISDFQLQALDGIRFLRLVKKIDTRTRTMILTASPTIQSEIEAQKLDVDKYVLKETRIDIILKYIEYLLSLVGTIESTENKILTSVSEDLTIDLDSRVVKKHGIEIPLTGKQYGILVLLLKEEGKAVSRERMIDELWDVEFEQVDSRIVDGHVKEIRKKLDIHSISSVRGYGYKWNE